MCSDGRPYGMGGGAGRDRLAGLTCRGVLALPCCHGVFFGRIMVWFPDLWGYDEGMRTCSTQTFPGDLPFGEGIIVEDYPSEIWNGWKRVQAQAGRTSFAQTSMQFPRFIYRTICGHVRAKFTG